MKSTWRQGGLWLGEDVQESSAHVLIALLQARCMIAAVVGRALTGRIFPGFCVAWWAP